jgi:folate-binding protein YgfZ
VTDSALLSEALYEALYRDLAAGKTGSLPLHRAVWTVTGADRARYLNGQVTHDVAKLAPGRSLYAAALTGKGKIMGDLFIAAAVDRLLLDAPLELRETLRKRLEQFLIADDAEFHDATEAGRLSHVFGTERPPEAPGRIVSANARFGLPGFDVWQEGPEPFLSGPLVPEALTDLFRIEYGIGAWGREIDANTLPQEALLDVGGRGLSYEKGCYVGQETVARLRSIGHVNRKLVVLEQVGAPENAAPGLKLEVGGEDAGRITSAAFSPLRQGTLALAYVGKKFLGGDKELEFVAGERRWKIVPPPRQ